MEPSIGQYFVQGGIGALALLFALYIFRTFMDQTKEQFKMIVDSIKEHNNAQDILIRDFKEHSDHMIEEIKDLVSVAIQNNKKMEG